MSIHSENLSEIKSQIAASLRGTPKTMTRHHRHFELSQNQPICTRVGGNSFVAGNSPVSRSKVLSYLFQDFADKPPCLTPVGGCRSVFLLLLMSVRNCLLRPSQPRPKERGQFIAQAVLLRQQEFGDQLPLLFSLFKTLSLSALPDQFLSKRHNHIKNAPYFIIFVCFSFRGFFLKLVSQLFV